MNKNSEFIRLYEELKYICNKLSGTNDHRGNFDLVAAKDKSWTVRTNERKIRHIRDVRNILQHPNHEKSYEAVLVSEQLTTDLQALVNSLKSPKTAKDICVPFNKIFYLDLHSRVRQATNVMEARSLSHVPILDINKKVLGVFSESSLFSYFCSDDILDASDDLKISDLLAFCSDGVGPQTFKFICPRTPLEKIYDLFTNLESPVQRVGTLFVTPSGSKHEPINGMLTAWDILTNILD